MGNTEPVTLLFRRLKQITLRANEALQRHDHLLADRIDRRVGDLGEKLFEIVVDQPRLV